MTNPEGGDNLVCPYSDNMSTPGGDLMPLYHYRSLRAASIQARDARVRPKCTTCAGGAKVCRCSAANVPSRADILQDRIGLFFPSARWTELLSVDGFAMSLATEGLLFSRRELADVARSTAEISFSDTDTRGYPTDHFDAIRERGFIQHEYGEDPTDFGVDESPTDYGQSSRFRVRLQPDSPKSGEHRGEPEGGRAGDNAAVASAANSPTMGGQATESGDSTKDTLIIETSDTSMDTSGESEPATGDGGSKPAEAEAAGATTNPSEANQAHARAGEAKDAADGLAPATKVDGGAGGESAKEADEVTGTSKDKRPGTPKPKPRRNKASALCQVRDDIEPRKPFTFYDEAALRCIEQARDFCHGKVDSYGSREYAERFGGAAEAHDEAGKRFLAEQRNIIGRRLDEIADYLAEYRPDWTRRLQQDDFSLVQEAYIDKYVDRTYATGCPEYTAKCVLESFEQFVATGRPADSPSPRLFAHGQMELARKVTVRAAQFIRKEDWHCPTQEFESALKDTAHWMCVFTSKAKFETRVGADVRRSELQQESEVLKALLTATRELTRCIAEAEVDLPPTWNMLTAATKPWTQGDVAEQFEKLLATATEGSYEECMDVLIRRASHYAIISMRIARICMRAARTLYERTQFVHSPQDRIREMHPASRAKEYQISCGRIRACWPATLLLAMLACAAVTDGLAVSDKFVYENMGRRSVNPEMVTFSREIDLSSITEGWRNMASYESTLDTLCIKGRDRINANRVRQEFLMPPQHTATASRELCAEANQDLYEVRNEDDVATLKTFMKATNIKTAWINTRFEREIGIHVWGIDDSKIDYIPFNDMCGKHWSEIHDIPGAQLYVELSKNGTLTLCFIDCSTDERCYNSGHERATICIKNTLLHGPHKDYRTSVKNCNIALAKMQKQAGYLRPKVEAMLPPVLWNEISDKLKHRAKRSNIVLGAFLYALIDPLSEKRWSTHMDKLRITELEVKMRSNIETIEYLAKTMDSARFDVAVIRFSENFFTIYAAIESSLTRLELIGTAARTGYATESALTRKDLAKASTFLHVNWNKILSSRYDMIRMILLRGPSKYFLMFSGPTVDMDQEFEIIKAHPFPDIDQGLQVLPVWYQKYFAVQINGRTFIPLDDAEAIGCIAERKTCFATQPRFPKSKRVCGISGYTRNATANECTFQLSDNPLPVVMTIENATCYNFQRPITLHTMCDTTRVNRTAVSMAVVQGKQCMSLDTTCSVRFGHGATIIPSNTVAISSILDAVKIGPRHLSNTMVQSLLSINSMTMVETETKLIYNASMAKGSFLPSGIQLTTEFQQRLLNAHRTLRDVQNTAVILVVLSGALSVTALIYTICSVRRMRQNLHQRRVRLIPVPTASPGREAQL